MKNSRLGILPIVSLLLIVVIFVVLGYPFFPIWRHKADNGAQAYGAFLSYVATAATVLVTLIYVYFTRESLKEAQHANKLQAEQWSQRVTIKPKFWLLAKGLAVHEFPFASNGERIFPPCHYDAFEMVIWNYSEQSFLVHAIELDIHTNSGRRTRVRDVNAVVRPHDTIKIDISSEIFNLICDTAAPMAKVLVDSLLPSPFSLISAIRYTDWQTVNNLSALLINIVRTESGRDSTASKVSIAIERRFQEGL